MAGPTFLPRVRVCNPSINCSSHREENTPEDGSHLASGIQAVSLATYLHVQNQLHCSSRTTPPQETARLRSLSYHNDIAVAFWLDWIKAGSGAPGTGIVNSPFLGSVRGYITVPIICLAVDRFAQFSRFRLPAPGREPWPARLVEGAVSRSPSRCRRELRFGLGRSALPVHEGPSIRASRWSPFWDRTGTKKPEGRPIRSTRLQVLQDAVQ